MTPPVSPAEVRAEPQLRSAIDLSTVLRALRTKWLVSLGTAAGIVILVAVITFLQPRTYTGTANLMVNHVAPISWGSNASIPLLSDLVVSNGQQTLETYAALVQSDTMADRVIRRLGLGVTSKELKRHVKVRPATNTNILGLAVTWSSAAEAARLANAYADEFIGLEREMNSSRARGAMTSIGRALAGARRDMLLARDREAAFETTNGVADAPTQTTGVIGQITTLDQRIGQLRSERDGAVAQLVGVGRMIAGGKALTGNQVVVQLSPARALLESQLSQVNLDLEKARTQFSGEYPLVVALTQQRAALRARLEGMPRTVVAQRQFGPDPLHERLQQDAAALRSQASGDDAQLSTILAQRAALIDQLRRLPGVSARLADLKRGATASETTYNALKEKYEQAVVANLIAMPDVALIEPADRFHVVKLPNTLLNLMIGLILALVGGLCAALLAATRDRSIHDRTDIERGVGLPVLAQLSNPLQARPTMSPSVSDFTAAWSLSEPGPLGMVLVCGSVPEDDAPWTASASAIAFARLGRSTLLLECGTPAGVATDHLAARLSDGRFLAECCAAPLVGDVQVLSIAGSPSVTRLFGSKQFAAFLTELKQRFDVIVVSGAPVNEATETMALAARADAIVLVLSQRGATTDQAASAYRMLATVAPGRILGAIYTSGMPPPTNDSAFVTESGIGAGSPSRITRLLSATAIPASAWSKAPPR